VTFVYAIKYNFPLCKYVPLFLWGIIHEVVYKVLAQAVYPVQILYSFNYLGSTGYFCQKIKINTFFWFKSDKNYRKYNLYGAFYNYGFSYGILTNEFITGKAPCCSAAIQETFLQNSCL